MGLGSNLHMWTQALCNAMQENVRVRTQLSWIYRDREACHNSSTDSTLSCYFPRSELRCPNDRKVLRTVPVSERMHLYVDNGVVQRRCKKVLKKHNVTLSDEAERQLTRVFGNDKPAPSQLITVHIRWGDKAAETVSRPIQEYVDAVHRFITDENLDGSSVNIFLASEDPDAVRAFQEAALANQWKVFVDAYFQEFESFRDPELNGNPHTTERLKGRPGLVALASLLVALQADNYVLTTVSN